MIAKIASAGVRRVCRDVEAEIVRHSDINGCTLLPRRGLWHPERLDDRRALLKLTFAERLHYKRNEGLEPQICRCRSAC